MTATNRLRRRTFAAVFGTVASLALTPLAALADPASPCTSVAATADGTIPTAPACNVAGHAALVEFGYNNTSIGGDAGFGVASYPSATLRYGVSNALEFDLNGPAYQRVRTASDVVAHGYGDAGLGLRYRVFDAGHLAVSALGSATLPTGDAAFTAGKSQYALGAAASYAFAPTLSVQSSIAYDSRYLNGGFGPQWYKSYSPAVALVAGAPSATSLYVGGRGDTTVAPGLGPQYALDAGVRRQLGRSTVLDLGAEDGITTVEGQRAHGVSLALSGLVR